MASDGTTSAPDPDQQKSLHPIEKIAKAIAALPNGKRAELRRAYLTGRLETEGIVISLLYAAGVAIPPNAEAFRAWKLVAHSAAVLSGTGQRGKPCHARGKGLGRALQAAGVSEDRMLRLTSSRGRILDALIVQSMRRVAGADKGPVDLFTLFDLIRHSDDDRGEAARLRIAGDFYAAKARSEKGGSSDD